MDDVRAYRRRVVWVTVTFLAFFAGVWFERSGVAHVEREAVTRSAHLVDSCATALRDVSDELRRARAALLAYDSTMLRLLGALEPERPRPAQAEDGSE